jgi:hypothetical protein
VNGANCFASTAVSSLSSLTTNYVPHRNGTALDNSTIYDNGTNVGIGTTSPTQGRLVSVGTSAVGPYAGLNDNNVNIFQVTYGGARDGVLLLNKNDTTNTVYLNSNGNSFINGGNVGIGQVAPGSRLVVKGIDATLSNSALNVTNSADSSMLFVRNNGNVGIGTTGPSTLLHVAGNSTFGNAVAATNVNMYINGVASKAARIVFQQSGVDKWLLGNGSASENNKFELYNATGTVVLSVDPTTSVSTFGAGVNVMNGNVGIGTTAPGARLDLSILSTDATTLPLSINKGTTNYVTVLNNGKVGIGTTSPGEKLVVAGNIVTGIGVAGTSAVRYGYANGYYNFSTRNSGNYWTLSRLGTGADPSGEAVSLDLMTVKYNGNVGIGTAAPGARLDLSILSTDATTLPLSINKGTTNYVTVLNNGNVGIGTTNPGEKLSVNGNIQIPLGGVATRYITTDETNTGTGKLVMQAGAGSATYGGAINLYANSHATKPGDVAIGLSAVAGAKFRVNDAGIDGGTDLLTVLRAGNVGIGTASPGEKLDIYQGNIGLTHTQVIKNTAGNTTNSIMLYDGSNGALTLSAGGPLYDYPMIFKQGNPVAEVMRIKSRNVGIGTTTP